MSGKKYPITTASKTKIKGLHYTITLQHTC